MPSFDVEFEVFCAKCGEGLCNVSDTRKSRQRSMPQVTVEPCAKCMEKAIDEADSEGYSRGVSEV